MRFWWISAFIFLLAAGYLAISQYQRLVSEARLLRDGVVVEAVVKTADGEPVTGKNKPKDSICELSYVYEGVSHGVVGRLEGRQNWIIVGSRVSIHIDPNAPETWTGRTEAGSSSINDWVAPLLIIPIVIFVAAIALIKRNRLLKLWRMGEAIPAIALTSRQTALAPRSRAVRLAPANSEDRRIYDVFIPHIAPVAEGDRVWLLVSPNGRGPVAAVGWFQN